MRHRRGPQPGETQYTLQEAVAAFALVVDLDPDKYVDPEAKALIYKCRADQAKGADTIYIHFT